MFTCPWSPAGVPAAADAAVGDPGDDVSCTRRDVGTDSSRAPGADGGFACPAKPVCCDATACESCMYF